MNRILLLVAVFSFGYVVNDIVQETKPVIFPLQAEVAGMDYYDLLGDWDFRRAVEEIVDDEAITSRAEVRRAISGNCYVDDGYVYR